MRRSGVSRLCGAVLPAGMFLSAACARDAATVPEYPRRYLTQVMAGVVVDPTGKPVREVVVRLTGVINGSLGAPLVDIAGCHGIPWLSNVSITTDEAGKFSYTVGMISNSGLCVAVEATPPAGLGLRAALVWLPRFSATSSTFQPDTTWIGVQLGRD